MPTTSQAVMEALESSLAEGGCSSLLDEGRNIYTKGTGFRDDQPVQNNNVAQRRGENNLRHLCKTTDIFPDRQFVY